jgi:hypothetical protein
MRAMLDLALGVLLALSQDPPAFGFRAAWGPTWSWGGDKDWHPLRALGTGRSRLDVAPHTGGQRKFISFFYAHPASGTAAAGAFNTGSGGPVTAKVRTACMETLSLPMAKRG